MVHIATSVTTLPVTCVSRPGAPVTGTTPIPGANVCLCIQYITWHYHQVIRRSCRNTRVVCGLQNCPVCRSRHSPRLRKLDCFSCLHILQLYTTNICTYTHTPLTPCSRVVLEKQPLVAELLKKFSVLYRNWKCITVLKRGHPWALLRPRLVSVFFHTVPF
jgi:hypothetical protein